MQIPRLQYFQRLLDNAKRNGLPEKADYYRRRITEFTKNPGDSLQLINDVPSKLTKGEMLESAIKIWNVQNHSAATRHAFLANKGIPEYIIFNALEYVGHGKKMTDI